MRRHEPGTQSAPDTFEARQAAGKVGELRQRIRQMQRGSQASFMISAPALRRLRLAEWRQVADAYHDARAGHTQLDWMREAGRAPEAVSLGREFLRAAERGDDQSVRVFLMAGFPANWQDPETGEAALHVAAGSKARDVARLLVETGFCDYLLRDAQGRLASELAYMHGEDPAVARLLGIKERKQAEAEGIALKRHGTPTHNLVRR